MTYRPQWLSEGYEDLIARLKDTADKDLDFDVVVVGSGYGGAVAAARLASATSDGNPLRVCVLERGREYVPGTFPHRFSELAGHVRFSRYDDPKAKGRADGLYDFRIAPDVSALVGSGLGGGSLINANVAERARDDVFADPAWPAALRRDLTPLDPAVRPRDLDSLAPGELQRHLAMLDPAIARRSPLASLQECYRLAEYMLGANRAPEKRYQHYQKFKALATFADAAGVPSPRPARITVNFRAAGDNPHGVPQQPCNDCGDCVTGCNFWAKNTLPMNYLARARCAGAKLYTNVTVSHVERDGDARHWRACFRPTADQHPRVGQSVVRAAHVILAAGAFGSTEILMRSRAQGLRVSAQLGKRFSGNGDMISLLYGQSNVVNAAPEESTEFEERRTGPTITGIIETAGALETGATRAERLSIEEITIPAPLRRLFEEVVTTAALPVQLGKFDWRCHRRDGCDPAAVDEGKISRSLVFVAQGDDGASGRLEMVEGWESVQRDGAIRVGWEGAGNCPVFERQDRVLRKSEAWWRRGLYLRSPLWQPLPEKFAAILEGPKPEGKLFTVHPLGGCPMGDDANGCVVDDLGRVFDPSDPASPARTHDGLLVLDGSVVPTALGINPLLTITALAERAIAGYAALHGWSVDYGSMLLRLAHPEIDSPKTLPRAVTGVRFAETMTTRNPLREPVVGKLQLAPGADPIEAELEVVFGEIRDLPDFLRGGPHRVRMDDAKLKLHNGRSAKLSGWVYWMERGRTGPVRRTACALWTWLRTRAIADGFQRARRLGAWRAAWTGIKLLVRAVALASNAGEMRYLRYDMTLKDPLHLTDGNLPAGTRIEGLKTFRYVTDGNPWRQLSDLLVTVTPPGGAKHFAGTLTIKLESFFRRFAVQLQVVRQRDQSTAIMDLASIALFMARVAFKVHFWSFRAPEYEPYDDARARRRLPGALVDLEMQTHSVRVDGQHAQLDLPLTRYSRGSPDGKRPVLLIHGFGASGAQFAHPRQERNLVRHLAEKDFDVWVAELRTSIAVPASFNQWTLDEVAQEDIPAIVQRVLALSGRPKENLDVVAHCIGSAMFCTAILSGDKQRKSGRRPLAEQIGRVVLLQVGPLIRLSDANRFRAYLAAAMRRYMLTDHVDSSVDERADWRNAFIDRVLSTYPYPDSELEAHRLCPPWKPHTHLANCNRSAAVFGRLFQHRNLNAGMLDSLGDLLGHTNLTTFEQTAQYAFLERLTDRNACNAYVTDDSVRKYFGFPVYFLHGELNDVFHPDTTVRSLKLLQRVFGKNCKADRYQIPGYGHLDPLIAANAEADPAVNAEKDVFGRISEFLDPQAARVAAAGLQPDKRRFPRPPLIGPLLGWTRRENGRRVARVWCRTHDTQSDGRFLIAVVLDGNGNRVPGHTYLAPLPRHRGRRVSTLDLIGVIDVPLPDAPDDYEIVLVSAHTSVEPDPESRKDVAGAHDVDPTELPEGAANLDAATPQVLDALPREDRDKYAEAVLKNRKRWIEKVRDSETAQYTFDPGYDERPDSVLIRQRVLDQLDAKGEEIVFALASCRYPASRLDRERADETFRRLRALLHDGKPGATPSLLLLAGDQIYSDATAGLFDPKNRRERFYDSYREAWTAPNAREVLRRIPTYMMMDDHEAGDDWHPEDPEDRKTRVWGLITFEDYQLSHSPKNPALNRLRLRRPYHYKFHSGGFPFFVCDTRSGREGHDCIMRDGQYGALTRWLMHQHSRDESQPKFVVSPSIVVPFLEATGGNPQYAARSDGWDGFPQSLTALFSFIARNCIRNVVFLCGDPHLSMMTRIGFGGNGLQDLNALCIVGSPLYAPYPFANRKPREFIDDNRRAPVVLDIPEATMHYSVVDRRYVEGDSFTVVKVERIAKAGGAGSEWEITTSVHLRDGTSIDTVAKLP